MSATVSRARVEIFDQQEGLICTFPCRSVAEAEALLETLVAQPGNEAYGLRLLGENGELLQRWSREPDASFNPVPVQTAGLYQLLRQKEHWMQESRREIARFRSLCAQSGQIRLRSQTLWLAQDDVPDALPGCPRPVRVIG